MTTHEDDEPVIFSYSAMSNISFRGEEDSGYEWGEWREMSAREQNAAYSDFVFETLGVSVFEVDSEDEE
jgi:hypothetical protein